MDYRFLENQYLMPGYPKRDIVIVRGSGAALWDVDGRQYIDCMSGHGVAILGHSHPAIAAALAEQAKKLVTCPCTFYNDERALFLEKLFSVTPRSLSRTFLCNSGAESVEAAIKFARIATRRTDFVCANRGFHGRTLGALSATHKPDYREPFMPLIPGFSHIPFNDVGRLREAITGLTAGIILEVVQGEGGVNIGSAEYFSEARKLCDETGALLIIDEVQTGFCRTGRMFACEHVSLEPDILCLAKGMAGGLPMGATICRDTIKMPEGLHGSTFGGNPLACSAARAAIGVMLEEGLAKQAEEKGKYLMNRLRELRLGKVRDVRGLGLMIGIELRERAKPRIIELMHRGILALPTGATVIRLLPPLCISYEEIDCVIAAISEVLV